ncbi:MAG: DUF5684 domain-containing protein [Alicyclobacillus sp.]|nr:DUF5684 domain-containing protein [Alicyclobacillus sp.]
MFGIVFAGMYWLVAIAIYVLQAIAFYRLGRRAGCDRIAWFSWVPILNTILQLRMIGWSGWWVLVCLVPVANIVFLIIWQVKLLHAFDKHGAFVLFLLFLPPIYTILWIVWGLSNRTYYVGPRRRSNSGGGDQFFY